MAVITKTEREEKLQKVTDRKKGAKSFIFFTLIFFVLFTIADIVCSFFGTQFEFLKWSSDKYNIGGTMLTIYGWIMFSVAAVLTAFGIISSVLICNLRSANKVFREVVGMPISTAKPIKKTKKVDEKGLNTKKAAAEAKKRLKTKAIQA